MVLPELLELVRPVLLDPLLDEELLVLLVLLEWVLLPLEDELPPDEELLLLEELLEQPKVGNPSAGADFMAASVWGPQAPSSSSREPALFLFHRRWKASTESERRSGAERKSKWTRSPLPNHVQPWAVRAESQWL